MSDARRASRLARFTTKLAYGGDYNPEQWDEEVWHQDLELMGRAGVNLASVGVFAWSHLEPEEGVYTFEWLDRVLDLLHGRGVRTALATPTASPPPWFSLAHPDALPVTAEGVRLSHGSRDTYAVCAPAYRQAPAPGAAVLSGALSKVGLVGMVRFLPLVEDEITAYVATGEPLDKAGALKVLDLLLGHAPADR